MNPGSRLALVLLVAACDPAPKFATSMRLSGVEIPAEVLNDGERIYTMRCASCHGEDGSGKGAAAGALKVRPRDFRAAEFQYTSTPTGELPTEADLDLTIRMGRVDSGMPAWPGLSDADRHAVIQYIKTFSPRWQAEPRGSGAEEPGS